MLEIIFVLVHLLIILVLFGVGYYFCYKRRPDGRVIVRTGLGGLQVGRAHGMIVVPFVHTSDLLFTDPVTLRLSAGLIDSPAIETAWQFTVAVADADELFRVAASRLLGKDSDAISRLAGDAIAGELSRAPEPAPPDHELGIVTEQGLRTGLGRFGLELLSYGPVG